MSYLALRRLYRQSAILSFIILLVLSATTDGRTSTDIEAILFPAQRRSDFDRAEDDIYSSVMGTIRNASLTPAEAVAINALSVAGDPNPELDISGKAVPLAAFNRTDDDYDDDQYFLGYSSNVFGSHTKYIEKMSGDSEYLLSVGGSDRRGRRKRSVVHLYNMVLCATGCNPLSYKGYGCYCGFLGSGYVVDGIDRCCKMHDWCYDTAGCPMFLEYFIPYLWQCYNHRHPICALDHGMFGGPGSCAQRLCECDRQLAQCLRTYPCPSSKALCTSSPWRLLQNIFMN